MKILFYISMLYFTQVSRANQDVGMTCTTPNGKTAKCISLYSCPQLLIPLATLEPAVIEFARKSQCGLFNDFMVCCDAPGNKSEVEPENETEDNPADVLPDKSMCGYQASDDRIRTTNKTARDEFPWMAILNYGGEQTCAGTFIALRYVLTAAHCITSNVKSLTVTLGSYTKIDNLPCKSDLCPESAIVVNVESIIVHEKYKPRILNYDIALLRLAEPVYYTDYIRPICLSLDEHSQKPQLGDSVFTSGWGKKQINGVTITIKKKLQHEIVDNKKCAKHFLNSQKFDNTFICTVPEYQVGICGRDAGGPVMYNYNDQWFVEGIVIFRIGKCEKDKPEGALNIRKVLKWILDNVHS